MASRGARLALSALAVGCRMSHAVVLDFPRLGHKTAPPPAYVPLPLPASYPSPPPPGYFKELAANKTACTCRNWAGIYSKGLVKCGAGAELFSYTGGEHPKKAAASLSRITDQTFCNDTFGQPGSAFFPRQVHNLCVRQNRFDAPGRDGGSWCYVSKGCTAPDTAFVQGSPLRARFCTPAENPTLGDLQPAALFDIARKQSTDYRLMAQMAYRPSVGPWDEGSRLVALRQTSSWRGNQWFPAAGDAVKVAWQDQLWHVFAEKDKFPVCTEGCGKQSTFL